MQYKESNYAITSNDNRIFFGYYYSINSNIRGIIMSEITQEQSELDDKQACKEAISFVLLEIRKLNTELNKYYILEGLLNINDEEQFIFDRENKEE